MEPTKKLLESNGNRSAEHLQALGYHSTFERSMTVWENFSLGFTYLSPVVGVYSVFALALAAGGPAMIWWYLIAGCGQMLVCLIFGEIVSQFPLAGGLYPWGRRLVGKRWSWMAGWIYGWALFTTVAGVAVGAGPFLASLFGFNGSPAITTAIALGLVPKLPVLRIVSAGNVAGEGAKMALLSMRERAAAMAMVTEVRYVELSDRADFNDAFVDQLQFPA